MSADDEPAATEAPTCPACGVTAPDGGAWCEACGADLAASTEEAMAAAPCVACNAPPQDIEADGYCSNCGQKQPAKRDHLEYQEGAIAGVTDRGKRHHRNEDACAVAELSNASVLVVCDGVSSTDRPDEASQVAADAVLERLRGGLTPVDGGEAIDLADPSALDAVMTDAIAAAHAAVSAVTSDIPNADPPSCTVVAAVIHAAPDAALMTVAWLGDSRAYWIDNENQVTQLTTDHSWSADQVALGELSAEAIAADKRAHSITRWLGADAPDVTPDIVHIKKPSRGRLLLCSDGLWNYAPTAEELTRLVTQHEGSAIDVARALVDFANESGGHDNITVALTPTPPTDQTDQTDQNERTSHGDVQR